MTSMSSSIFEHPLGGEERVRLVSGRERAADRAHPLGQEEPLRRLLHRSQLRVTQIEERGEPGVGGIVDGDPAHQFGARRRSSSTSSTGVVSAPSR